MQVLLIVAHGYNSLDMQRLSFYIRTKKNNYVLSLSRVPQGTSRRFIQEFYSEDQYEIQIIFCRPDFNWNTFFSFILHETPTCEDR